MDPIITPPQILPPSVDRRVFEAIHGLPHSPQSDRYISLVSDLGEGMGWVAAGNRLAWRRRPPGRRPGGRPRPAPPRHHPPRPGGGQPIFPPPPASLGA